MSANEDRLYIYRWGPQMPHIPGVESMGNRKNQLCRRLVLGGMNSVLIRFESDGLEAVVSRSAICRADSEYGKKVLQQDMAAKEAR